MLGSVATKKQQKLPPRATVEPWATVRLRPPRGRLRQTGENPGEVTSMTRGEGLSEELRKSPGGHGEAWWQTSRV